MMNLSIVFAAILAAAPAAKSAKANPPTGGLVRLNGEGRVALVNACNAPESALQDAARRIGNILMIEVTCPKGKWTLATAPAELKAQKANVAVFVVNDESLPLSLIALEQKWGMVNAAGLDESALKKEVLRVATIVLGGASSKYPASVMRPVFAPADLKKTGEVITIDSLMAIFPNLEALGIKRYDMMTYRDACEEGIAPAPVTDEQRKIAAEFKK